MTRAIPTTRPATRAHAGASTTGQWQLVYVEQEPNAQAALAYLQTIIEQLATAPWQSAPSAPDGPDGQGAQSAQAEAELAYRHLHTQLPLAVTRLVVGELAQHGCLVRVDAHPDLDWLYLDVTAPRRVVAALAVFAVSGYPVAWAQEQRVTRMFVAPTWVARLASGFHALRTRLAAWLAPYALGLGRAVLDWLES